MRFLYLFTRAPYHNRMAREALDMALASAAFDQEVSLYFCGEGIFQLLKDQQDGPVKKSHLGVINALPLYDISRLYYHSEDLVQLGLSAENLVSHAKPASEGLLAALIGQCDCVQSF